MQTVEGKTPLFCTILSGDIQINVKKEIIKLLFDSGNIDLSLRKATGEDLLKLAKNNSLYEFIVVYCLREDWVTTLISDTEQTQPETIVFNQQPQPQTFQQIKIITQDPANSTNQPQPIQLQAVFAQPTQLTTQQSTVSSTSSNSTKDEIQEFEILIER